MIEREVKALRCAVVLGRAASPPRRQVAKCVLEGSITAKTPSRQMRLGALAPWRCRGLEDEGMIEREAKAIRGAVVLGRAASPPRRQVAKCVLARWRLGVVAEFSTAASPPRRQVAKQVLARWRLGGVADRTWRTTP